MRSAIALMVAILLTVSVVPSPAAADGDGWQERYRTPGQDDGRGPGGELDGHLHWGADLVYDHPDVEPNDNGTVWCWGLQAELLPDPPAEEATYAYVREMVNGWEDSGSSIDPCPDPVPLETIALELWVGLSIQGLEDLRVPPGYALTGLPAYLVFGGEQQLTASTEDEFSGVTISIEAAPTYLVDWGDGSDIEVTRNQGKPYPAEGDDAITTTYTDKGDHQIEVVTQWDATFSAPGIEAQPLPPRWTVDTVDLEVREYRAVRVSPDR